MIRELRLRNFAVVETARAAFAPGLNVLTGETGAGKSILIDALLLVGGARAQADVIRAEAESAVVEAVFEISPGGSAATILEDAGLGVEDGQVVIRRELSRSGRHRAFVNDSAVTVSLLERLGDQLVEVHGQHEHQRLLEPAHQLDLLDRFADAEELRARVDALAGELRQVRAEGERRQTRARDRAQREDLLRLQLSELEAARLRQGEDEELRAERRRIQHAERITAGLEETRELLGGDADSALTRIGRATRVLGELGRIHPPLGEPADALETARLHIDEALTAIRGLGDDVTVEPGRLDAIEERLHALERLRRKYGDTEATMLEFLGEVRRELEALDGDAETASEHAHRTSELEAALAVAAAALTDRRVAAAAQLATQTEAEIRQLGMERRSSGSAWNRSARRS